MKISAPPPIEDGSEIQCPMVDVARIEAMPADQAANIKSRDELLCRWRQEDSAEAREEYQRHFNEYHWEPFVIGTNQMIRKHTG